MFKFSNKKLGIVSIIAWSVVAFNNFSSDVLVATLAIFREKK